MQPFHLQNAPIIEAMIELVVEPPEGEVAPRLAALRAELHAAFPIERERHQWQVEFALGEDVPLTASTVQQRPLGYLFFSEVQDRAVQVSPERFAYSQLRSYSCWETLSEEASASWALFTRTLAPRRVKGVVLRFINRLELPLGGTPPGDYLRLFPNVPEGLPQIAQSTMQVVMHDPTSGAVAFVTQTVTPTPETEGVFAVGLDVQVRAEVDLAVDDPALWQKLDSLRPLKNQIFFASVTERALERYR